MDQAVTIARSAVFSPLGDAGRASVIASRLEDAILLGILAPGERLPAEAQLAARFNVATVTVREALESLRESRLVETRRGRGGGSFVAIDDGDRRAAVIARIRARSRAELADLGTYYVAIAGEGLRLAADHATPRDVAGLERELEAGDFSTEFAARRTLGGLHLHATSLSQSVRLVREQLRVQATDGPLLWTCLVDAEWRDAARASCERIVASVRDGRGADARDELAASAAAAVRWLLTRKSQLETEDA